MNVANLKPGEVFNLYSEFEEKLYRKFGSKIKFFIKERKVGNKTIVWIFTDFTVYKYMIGNNSAVHPYKKYQDRIQKKYRREIFPVIFNKRYNDKTK